jgi:FkbM family methyltransferase
MPRIAYPVLLGPLQGAKFILGALSGKGGGSSIYFNMLEPAQTIVLVDSLKKGQVFFDIGANVGYYTILGAKLVGAQGKVLAFEPVTRNLSYLYKHVLLNNANNVSIISAACSDTLSLTTFSLGSNHAMGHIIQNNALNNQVNEKIILVPTVTVDAVIQQLGYSPNVIKIDVEGAELLVLKGAQVVLREVKPLILLSTHSDDLRYRCLEYLKDFDYIIDVLSEDKNNPTEFLAK